MPGAVIGTSLNFGFPGTFSRNGDCVITPRQVKSTDSAGPKFGAAVVLIQDALNGKWSDAAVFIAAAGTVVMTQGTNGAFAGFAVREVKTLTSFNTSQPITPLLQGYAPGDIADVLERGSISIVLKNPQATVNGYVAGGKVYLRIALNGSFPSAAVGDLEVSADGGNTLQLTNVYQQSGLNDANNVSEVTVMSRNTP